MAMIHPASQDGWYYDHWFFSPKKPRDAGRGKRLLLALTFLVLTAGGIALVAAAPAVTVFLGIP